MRIRNSNQLRKKKYENMKGIVSKGYLYSWNYLQTSIVIIFDNWQVIDSMLITTYQ